MARRDPQGGDPILGRASLLPGVTAYDDLEGVNGAWQSVLERGKVREHLKAGGRVHVAVEDRWLIAYPAVTWDQVPDLTITSTIQTDTAPGSTVIDSQGIWQITHDGAKVPHPRFGGFNRPADTPKAPEPPC